jgi:hypothetical protein
MWYVNLLVHDMPVHSHSVTSQEGTSRYLSLLISGSIPEVAAALGRIMQDAATFGSENVKLDVNAFVQESITRYRVAIKKWGMQLNTCVHVVADPI